jgi:hypothetical protein
LSLSICQQQQQQQQQQKEFDAWYNETYLNHNGLLFDAKYDSGELRLYVNA